jgi:hypothetical protein
VLPGVLTVGLLSPPMALLPAAGALQEVNVISKTRSTSNRAVSFFIIIILSRYSVVLLRLKNENLTCLSKNHRNFFAVIFQRT